MEVDKKLLERVKIGDDKSQRKLFDLFKTRWLGLCVRYVKDRDEANDVFQEAAIRIFSDVTKLRELDSFEGWARKIMVNHALNHLRKKKVYVVMLQEYTEHYDERSQEDVEIIRQMDSDELLRVIGELPDGYRLVLNLALIDGYNHAEIAKALSISESTSRSQLSKARKYLQRLLENQKIKQDARIAG